MRQTAANMSAPRPHASARADFASRRAGLLIWGVPLALIAIGVAWPGARAVSWVVAFTLAGVGCVLNARRCGRTHCHVTGPLYLGLAALSALIGSGALDWGWHIVGIAAAVGTGIAFVPELIGPRYLQRSR